MLNISCTWLRTDVSAHICKSSVFIIRAFLHAHKHFTCNTTWHMLVKDSKENVLVQNTSFKAFSYFSVLEIPPNSNSVDYKTYKKEIPMQFPFCKHTHVREHLHHHLYKKNFTNVRLLYLCEGKFYYGFKLQLYRSRKWNQETKIV